jgi:tetratricopeptide (TPR) repeat protein
MDRTEDFKPASPNSDAGQSGNTFGQSGSEASSLKAQVQLGELAGLREYLSRSRKECDWQDRVFMLGNVAPGIRLAALDLACDTEPEAAELFLIRCSFYSRLAWTVRGNRTVDKIAEGRFHSAADCIRAALTDLETATKLDADDPTAYACILPSLRIFGQLQPQYRLAFQQAVGLAPNLVPAYDEVVKSLAERWYGSHEKSLQFARDAMAKAEPGSDMPACLFQAHNLVRTHFIDFEKDRKAAHRYLHNSEVTRELNAAFDSWTQAPYVPRRSSIPYLHYAAHWYYLVEDAARLQRTLSLTGNVFSEEPWSRIGNAREVYARAVQIAGGKTQPPLSEKREPRERAVGFIAHAVKSMEAGKLIEAGVSFMAALALAHTSPKEESRFLIPLVLLNRSLLSLKQRKQDKSTKLREKAAALLDANREQIASETVQRLLANVLYKLSDYRRAVGFLEHAISSSEKETDPFIMAEMLHKVGNCYNQMGLMDHAAVPLRAALKIYEAIPEDPRLPNTLLTLGNALRKSSPAEAEAIYNRVVELRVARMQYESACAAWVNLGIVCAEQGRYAESLEHYERVMRVREQTTGTPPERVATVLNNMANCYRRMGEFAKAHAAVDRALKLLSAKDAALPSVFGTKASICLDAGEDLLAIEWIRKAHAEREKQSSPNLDTEVENLENEIVVLQRLGREDEAAIAREKLASVRATMQSIRQISGHLGAMKTQMEGAVLVELPFGSRSIRSEGRRSGTFLANMLSEAVRAQDAGHYGGWVVVPENTTLFFYGPNAEWLFEVLEPSLRAEPLCAGARVLIRQGRAQQEVVIPRKAETLN